MRISGVVTQQIKALPPLAKPNPNGDLHSFSVEGLTVLVPKQFLATFPVSAGEVEVVVSTRYPQKGSGKHCTFWLQAFKVL